MKRNEVLSILHKHEDELREKYGVESLALFGSMARDEACPDSDVDLLVKFNRPVGLFGLIALQQHLESLLGCKVDLGTPRSLRPDMKEQVLQEAVHVA
ncbi:MAG: nucleotidyltransferase family protein [Anaerolineales bacterium]|jgi:predicted nucleotidyltransferase|nr:nucleotidyltransferase family protein [Anaerolineales bacterium]